MRQTLDSHDRVRKTLVAAIELALRYDSLVQAPNIPFIVLTFHLRYDEQTQRTCDTRTCDTLITMSQDSYRRPEMTAALRSSDGIDRILCSTR